MRQTVKAIVWIVLATMLGGLTAQRRVFAGGATSVNSKEARRILGWKKRALKIPNGSYLKVKLQDKQKVEGQLRDISDAGLTIQGLDSNGKIGTTLVSFGDLKAVNVAGRPTKKGKFGKAILKVGMGPMVP